MSELKVGDVLEFPYPFYDAARDSSCDCPHITPGCYKSEGVSVDYWGNEHDSFIFIAEFMGSVSITIVSIAEVGGRYMDRVFYKKEYKDHLGDTHKSQPLHVATMGKVRKWISENSVFPVYYEDYSNEE